MSTTKKKNDWESEKIEAAKGTTYIAVIIDQSSSMSSSKEQAVAGYNETVDELWGLAKEGNDIKVSLVTFDTFVYEHLWMVDASELKKSNYDSFKPQLCTALWDGLGYTVDKLMETKLNDDDAVLVILISDGHENSSKHVDVANLRAKIEEVQNGGQWTFTYMGCSMQALQQMSRATSIPVANMAAWDSHDYKSTGRAMAQNCGKLGGYMENRKLRHKATRNFHSDQDEVAADYTSEDGHGTLADCLNLSASNDFIALSGGATSAQSLNCGVNNAAPDMTFNATTGQEVNLKVEGGVDVFCNNNQVDLSSYGMKNLS